MVPPLWEAHCTNNESPPISHSPPMITARTYSCPPTRGVPTFFTQLEDLLYISTKSHVVIKSSNSTSAHQVIVIIIIIIIYSFISPLQIGSINGYRIYQLPCNGNIHINSNHLCYKSVMLAEFSRGFPRTFWSNVRISPSVSPQPSLSTFFTNYNL